MICRYNKICYEKIGMKIVTIDSGVEIEHEALRSISIIGGVCIEEFEDSKFVITNDSFVDEDGHGTSMLGTICMHNKDIEVFIIKLKGLNQVYTESLICEGVSYAINIKEVKIISICLAVITETPSEKLRDLCKEANKNGIFIVSSAFNDMRYPSFPANFENVFGVGTGYFPSISSYKYVSRNKINILAHGTKQTVPTINGEYTESLGSSYAAAHFTGILANLLLSSQQDDTSNIFVKVKESSMESLLEVPVNLNSSEMLLMNENLINFQEEKFFSIIDDNVKAVAMFLPYNDSDFKGILGNVFHKLKVVLRIELPGYSNLDSQDVLTIDNVPSFYQLSRFDSVIIGNLTDGSIVDDFKYSVIEMCIKNNKNIITWDYPVLCIVSQIISKLGGVYIGKIYTPYYSSSFMDNGYLNFSLPSADNIPCLAIIDMEQNLSDDHFQLQLADYLTECNYTVSNIITDPKYIVYKNIDILFPYNAKRMVELEWGKWEIFLRLAKRYLAYQKQPDIFLTSVKAVINKQDSQGIHIRDNEALLNNIFLHGFKPDSYIGVISSNYNYEDVSKTCVLLESLFGIEPLFFINYDSINNGTQYFKVNSKKKVNIFKAKEREKIIKAIEKKFGSN
jgi:hypothetical protein